jgi:hypothetical protein
MQIQGIADMATVDMAVVRTEIVGRTAVESSHIRNYSGPVVEVEVEDDCSLAAGQFLVVAHIQLVAHTPTVAAAHNQMVGHSGLGIVIEDTSKTVEGTRTEDSRLAGRLTRGMEELGDPDTPDKAGDQP